jgi:hypothetical protein
MNEASITKYITDTFSGLDVIVGSKEAGSPEIAWGDTFFSYDPDRKLTPDGRFPFATIVTKDYGDFDCASNLNRPGVFRLNIGVSRVTFQSLFGGASDGIYDFAALDQIMPHPAYGKMFWVCVLNPSDGTFEKVKPLLAEAYEIAAGKHNKRDAYE